LTIRGFMTVASVECVKLAAQVKARIVLVACVIAPFAFAAALHVQSALPEDTLFGRSVKESGFALPLVVLGFAALWVLPALTSIVGGDAFASEDRYGTWKTVLTRSRSRSEVFFGKVTAALGFSALAIIVLAVSSIAAGVLVIGARPLISLSGSLIAPSNALTRVALAWLSVLPPVLGLTMVALLLSVTTKSSAAGIGLPVVIAMSMQLVALMDGPELAHRLLITSAFGAWHGLLAEPPYYTPIMHGTIISGVYFVVCLLGAYIVLLRRDIAGA
jgi:ABC-2 type transport system permease protein